MKKLTPYNLLILIFGFLASCGKSDDNSKEIITQDTGSAESEMTISVDSITENKFAYIKDVQKLNSAIFIKVDYVDYLTGQEALDAEWRDEAYFIDGEDTITNITNGYYLSNVNPKIRTFKLKDKIAVEHIMYDNGAQRMNESKELNVQQIETYIEKKRLLFFYINNGIVERIDERFMP